MKDITKSAQKAKTLCEINRLEHQDNIDTYEGKWGFLVFFKEGTHKSTKTWNSEQEVIDFMENWLAEANQIDFIEEHIVVSEDTGEYLFTYPEEYKGYVPIPKKEETL